MAEKNSGSKATAAYIAGLIFSIGGMGLSGLLICKHMFPDLCTGHYGCTVSGIDGCTNLGKSQFSKIFGIPLALPGFFFYTFLTLLFSELIRSRKSPDRFILTAVAVSLAAFGIVFDTYLAYINFIVMEVPCMLCAYSYIATIGLSIGAFMAWFTDRPDSAEL
jgi:uncharacterized membrane protein